MLTGDAIYGNQYGNWLLGLTDTPFMDGREGGDGYFLRNLQTHIHDTGNGSSRDWVYLGSLDETHPLSITLLDETSADPIGDLVFKGIEDVLEVVSYSTVESGQVPRWLSAYDYGLTVFANSSNNALYGGDGEDIFLGGLGSDTLKGGGGDDALYGGGDADWLNGQNGNDILYGGTGNDTLYGGVGRDQIFGGKSNDRIFGENGHDVIYAGSGDDWVEGGDGNDLIQSASGSNKIEGNDGDDRIWGGKGADRISGDKGNDVVLGRAGDDDLRGEQGVDRLMGNAGDDRIFGGSGRDVLIGGVGRDYLVGGDGNDILTGGLGGQNGDGMTDTFVFSNGYGRTGYDTILDFEVGIDRLVVERFGYDGDFQRFFADAEDHSKGVLIAPEAGGMLLLVDVDLSQITADMVDLFW